LNQLEEEDEGSKLEYVYWNRTGPSLRLNLSKVV